MEHVFNCYITLGNLSIYETELQKKALRDFLGSFGIAGVKIQKDIANDGAKYYWLELQKTESSLPKLNHFVEALISFCRYWRMSYAEGHYS